MKIHLKEASEIICSGGVVAVPTETVYGLAGDASSDSACLNIYQIKNRPENNPLIIHLLSLEQAENYAYFTEDAVRLAEKLWPGPMTLVLKKKDSNLSNIVSAGKDTIAIRVPSHEIMRELIKITEKPLAAPSANKSERISPTTSSHVEKNLGDIPILEGGRSVYGIESTIIDCTKNNPKILRQGFITEDVIIEILQKPLLDNTDNDEIIAPGMLKKHYAPLCKLKINAKSASNREIAINFGDSNLIGYKTYNLSTKGNLIEAAANLYNILQIAEDDVLNHNLDGIVVAEIPNCSIGLAINDKLVRACS